MKKLKLSEWQSPPPVSCLRPEQICALQMKWPAYKDDAHIDRLTGLPNRHAFDEMLSIAVKEATHQGAGFALIIFGIDNFSSINDNCGQKVGDCIIKEFARRLSGAMRMTDVCARYDGEGFALLTVVPPEKVPEIGENVRLAIRHMPFSVPDSKPVALTCSFGSAIFPFGATTWKGLLEKAEGELHKARDCKR